LESNCLRSHVSYGAAKKSDRSSGVHVLSIGSVPTVIGLAKHQYQKDVSI
jgi:hypothetical protein